MRSFLALLLISIPMTAAEIPRPAAPIAFPAPGGSSIELANFKGKPVVLEFLLTTCDHCQRASQMLQKLEHEFQPRGLQIIGAAINTDSAQVVEDFRKRFNLSFPVGMAESMRPKVIDFLQHSAVKILSMPQIVFIDRNGIIRAQHVGEMDEDQMRAEINKLVAPNSFQRGRGPKRATR